MASLPIAFEGAFLTGRSLYEEVIRDGMLQAKRSIWIATANVKELFVERGREYVSVLRMFDELAERGVELRLLHAELPSKRFRAAFERRKKLQRRFKLKHCPRVHLKAIIVDGARLYIGSANFTGAGLGAKGDDKRNFEFGIWTEDFRLLDEAQALYQRLWEGDPCSRCALRDVCPDPGPYSR